MILRTILSAAPSSYKTPPFRNSPQTPLRECVFTCTCVFLVFVMERMIPDGKNIKNLKASKL